MPRIRSIKPTFWDDDRLVSISLQAVTVYLAIKNFCDDNGVIPANEKLIKSKIFPQRDDIRLNDISRWIKELIENSFLVPFQFKTVGYYALDFSQERIDKPQAGIIPANDWESIKSNLSPHQFQEHSRTFENIPSGIGIGKDKEGNRIRAEDFLFSVNSILGKKFKLTDDIVKKWRDREKDGYTIDDVKRAVSAAKSDSFHIEKKLRYLTAEYFTRVKTLEMFCNAAPEKVKETESVRDDFYSQSNG